METILEQQRRYHEERERIIERMVHVSLNKTEHDQIHTDQCLKHLYELFQCATLVLKELYEDKDENRKNEVAALSGPNEFSEFYFRLKDIKEYYKKHPNEICFPASVEFEKTSRFLTNKVNSTISFEFNDEEGAGKYLDLHECYEKYINIRGIEKIDYICYLDTFDQLYDVPKERKNMDYKIYLEALSLYLFNYISKIRPLFDVEKELEKIDNQFARDWVMGVFPGWPKEYESALANNGAYLDLSAFSNWEELASLGLDRLKSALLALNMKCGGTLEERAQRLFSTKGVSILDSVLITKKHKVKDNVQEMLRQRSIANLEAKIYRWSEIVAAQRIATKENVQRKQARTVGERENSDGDITDTDDDNDDSNEEIPYNPKNLPLGWDGKPIPYWLYKLHGLNLSYNCEICGNFTYKGPKSFQRHFAEWRHAHGMRCLRIPNTAHFANITQIEDAILLWERLKSQKYNEYWIPALEEEFEDSLGNVVNRKTYEDLKRQGLL